MSSAVVGPPAPSLPAHLQRQAEEERRARELPWGWKAGPVAASLFDALATRDAINRGGVEANPVMAPFADNDTALIASKVGSGLLSALIAAKLARDGHPTAARLVSGISIGVPLAAGGINLASGRNR